MAKKRILAVDDEEDILRLVKYNLKQNNYKVDCALNGQEAFDKMKSKLPDLILLDLMLPDTDGLEICRMVKSDSKTSHIPIIMLTAKSEEADIVTGLELGADDYMTKPFSPRILLARIKTVLRREREQKQTPVYSKHDIVLNTTTHEVYVKDELVSLTATEFNILLLLMRRTGWVFTRNQIIDEVKGDDYPVTDRSVDVQIVGLRKKLGSSGVYIDTVRGVGYRFKE